MGLPEFAFVGHGIMLLLSDRSNTPNATAQKKREAADRPASRWLAGLWLEGVLHVQFDDASVW